VTKDQWKILGYLLGIVVATAGDGWAVQLDLSYRSDSITATDGSVVIQNNQGNPIQAPEISTSVSVSKTTRPISSDRDRR